MSKHDHANVALGTGDSVPAEPWARLWTAFKVSVTLFACLMALVYWSYQNSESQRRKSLRQVAKHFKQMNRWEEALHVPPSALYTDRYARLEIARIRKQQYERLGVTQVVAYHKLHEFSGDEGDLKSVSKNLADVSEEELAGATFDVWSRENAANACCELAAACENGELTEVPPKTIWLLSRLLRGISPETDWLRVCACRALLALGDSSEQVKTTLANLLAEPPEIDPLPESSQRARAEASRLNRKYDLRLAETAESSS